MTSARIEVYLLPLVKKAGLQDEGPAGKERWIFSP
jgi:hypothetical protein